MIAGRHLTLVTERDESLRAFNEFKSAFAVGAALFQNHRVGFRGRQQIVDVYWRETDGIWGLFVEEPGDQEPLDRFWIGFGVADPNQHSSLNITVEINPPHEGENRRTAGVFLRDELGRLYVGHDGRVGGGRLGIGGQPFRKFAREDAQDLEWQEIATPKGRRDVVVFGPFQNPALLLDGLARYVRTVARFKYGVATHQKPEEQIDAPPTAMTVQFALERFLSRYPEIRAGKSFGVDEELWGAMEGLKEALLATAPLRRRSHVRVVWSVGHGEWARVPWVALLDDRETTSTQRGVYGVFLFREDMTGAYLTLNQGVTELKKQSGAAAGLQLLRERAAALRKRSQDLTARGYQLDDGIDLRTEAGLGMDYEVSTVAYKLYERGAVPDDSIIVQDLEALLRAYDGYLKTEAGAGDTSRPEKPRFTFEEALKDLFLERGELQEMLALWTAKKNLVLQGAPGVGKNFLARRLAYLLMGRRDDERLRMVQFHQAYAYEDFIQGYRPGDAGRFERKDGVFYDFCRLAEADPEQPYVFIIDEINRGNLGKILGELMMLIEADKRGPEFAIPLTYRRPDDRDFAVPANLHLLGLMNTADRSLAMVDYALRRRFAFFTLEPRFASPRFRAYLERHGADTRLIDVIVGRMTELNATIEEDKTNLGPGFRIGHSFFTVQEGAGPPDEAWYRRVVRSEIQPLLREYWFDDSPKAEHWAARLLGGF